MLQNSIVPNSNYFSPEKVALIKRTIADGASDDELALFIAQCQRTGLDPFSRQIYSIQRQVFDPKLNRKVPKMITQVSIDGLRLIAERSGLYAGQLGPFYTSNEGKDWTDIWSSSNYPFAAKVGVVRKDFAEPLYSVAYWSEYCPMYDGKPAQMWTRFPTLMLAKCAEALALRRAFPQDLSDLFMAEEMTPSVLQSNSGSSWVLESQLVDPASASEIINGSPVPDEPLNDVLDPQPALDEDERPYSPLRLRALISEVAVKLPPAAPSIVDRVAVFLQNTLSSPEELGAVSYFLSASRDVRRASLRVVNAIFRWLKFDGLANPSSLSLEELSAVRSHLSNK